MHCSFCNEKATLNNPLYSGNTIKIGNLCKGEVTVTSRICMHCITFIYDQWKTVQQEIEEPSIIPISCWTGK